MAFLNNSVVIISTLACLGILFHRTIRRAVLWRATVTPLASIIGSGFLVSAPLLQLTTGRWATVVMFIIVSLAYAIGSSIRLNINYFEPLLEQGLDSHRFTYLLESLSKIALGLAYIVSIAFYIKLLSAFALRGFNISAPLLENLLSTLILFIIGLTGVLKGLSLLENYEIYAVNTKLAIIIALIIGHAAFNVEHIINGTWLLKLYPHEPLIITLRKLLGTLIIIQGFETSRFLGHSYNAITRINTMHYAQIIAGIIYVAFIATTMIAFNDIHTLGETTVIDLCRMMAPVLPFLLIIAAVMSQFSAAVADTVGSGGLLTESLPRYISVKTSYLLIAISAIALTWLTNIYEIISIASKAFAIYYALQLVIAIQVIRNNPEISRRGLKIVSYALLFLLMLLVIVFGIPVK